MTVFKNLEVSLGDRSYPIIIGTDVWKDSSLWADKVVKRGRILIVTNDTVNKWYLEPAKKILSSFGVPVNVCILPDGEEYKDLNHFNDIITCLMENDAGRDTSIFALGGGVIGDMAGFAAACYQRGIDFFQLPTTLLADVDSSVGGKTAVNHSLGKNMIGAFYQPRGVFIDPECLKTLPDRQLASGMAEVIKYGIIWDKDFFSYLEKNTQLLWKKDPEVVSEIIYRCCAIKAEVVHEDEKEGGIRAILNLGHTFGHAIENFMGYGVWLHGEGVAAGMMIASYIAEAHGYLSANDVKRIKDLIEANKLPVKQPDNMTLHNFAELMLHDKKNRNGKIRYIIPDSLGRASLKSDISLDEVGSALKRASAA